MARLPVLGLLSLIALLTAACDEGGPRAPAQPAGAPTPAAETAEAGHATAEAEPALALGIAGIVPAGWPSPSGEQWTAFYRSLPGTGGLLGAYTDWRASPGSDGVPGVVESQTAAGGQFGFAVLPLLGFHQDAPLRPTIDWADEAQAAEFERVAVALATRYQPPYLGIGNEVNRIWEEDPAAFDAFAARLPSVAEAVREASPGTMVFTTFQYETLRGEAFLAGGSDSREPQWALVDAVAPALDLVVFTSYPYFDFETPEAIPDEYYREAAERAGKPIAFSELGWPSRPLSTAPDSGYGGTEAEQAAFVERFFALTEGLDVRFAMWLFAYDAGPTVGPAFESVGLSANDGGAKPALERWLERAAAP